MEGGADREKGETDRQGWIHQECTKKGAGAHLLQRQLLPAVRLEVQPAIIINWDG